MKKKFKAHLWVLLAMVIITIYSCGNSTDSSVATDTIHTTTTVPSLPKMDTLWMDNLKAADGKYAFDIKLFENDSFNQKLKATVGDKYYSFIKDICSVQTPIKSNDSFFVLSACQAHNCAASNVLIILDYKTQKMYIDLFDDGDEHTFGDKEILQKSKQEKEINTNIS